MLHRSHADPRTQAARERERKRDRRQQQEPRASRVGRRQSGTGNRAKRLHMCFFLSLSCSLTRLPLPWPSIYRSPRLLSFLLSMISERVTGNARRLPLLLSTKWISRRERRGERNGEARSRCADRLLRLQGILHGILPLSSLLFSSLEERATRADGFSLTTGEPLFTRTQASLRLLCHVHPTRTHEESRRFL